MVAQCSVGGGNIVPKTGTQADNRHTKKGRNDQDIGTMRRYISSKGVRSDGVEYLKVWQGRKKGWGRGVEPLPGSVVKWTPQQAHTQSYLGAMNTCPSDSKLFGSRYSKSATER